jgi:hypothetical protein
MTPTFSIAIMHAPRPERKKMLRDLLADLGGVERIEREALRYTLVTDTPRSGKEESRAGVWPTAKRAWKAYHPDADYHIVLQDDITPAREFWTALPLVLATLAEQPPAPIGLAANVGIGFKARDRGHAYWQAQASLVGCAIALPVPMLNDFLAWEERSVSPDLYSDDVRISFYCLDNGIKQWYPTFALFRHTGVAHSLLGHSRYRSVRPLHLDDNPLDITDWTTVPESPLCHRCHPDMKRYFEKYVVSYRSSEEVTA